MTDKEITFAIQDGDVCRVRDGHLWQNVNLMLPGKQRCVLCGRWREKRVTWTEEKGSGSVSHGDVVLHSQEEEDE